MIGKNELYFAKRDLEFCPVGMAAFILLFLPLIFPAGFRSYDWVPHIGVISSSQTCLSAGPDNCTEREAGREGEENRSGRKIQTDRPVIYSHLIRIDLAQLHQWTHPVAAFLYFSLNLGCWSLSANQLTFCETFGHRGGSDEAYTA